MKLRKKALLYDIANMAYLIADTGEHHNHSLHKVRDICQDGNIDRVSRILGLAYSNLLACLSPVVCSPRIDINCDNSASPHDYEFTFKEGHTLKFALTTERKLKIKEFCHEYMVCMVLCHWLEVTLPVAADVWKDRAEMAIAALHSLVYTITSSSITMGFKRRISPI